MKNEQNNAPRESFPKHYIIKFPRLNIETDLDIIATQREILNKIGKYDGNIKKHSSSSLLIKVKSREQGIRLEQLNLIANKEVIISEHRTMNQSKGTVYSKAMSNTPINELLEALKDQRVIQIERMKARVQGELQETHRYILTFNQPDPPGTIKLSDWHRELVDLFIPRPMRCNNCWRLGHTQKHCRRPEIVCYRCAGEGHRGSSCNRPIKCANCYQDHLSSDKECPLYVFKCEVLATQVRLKYGYKEAEDNVRERFHASGRQTTFNRPRQSRPDERERETEENNNDRNISEQTNTEVDAVVEPPRTPETKKIDKPHENEAIKKDELYPRNNKSLVEYSSSDEIEVTNNNDNSLIGKTKINKEKEQPTGVRPKSVLYQDKESPKSIKTMSRADQKANPHLQAINVVEKAKEMSVVDIPLPIGPQIPPQYVMKYDPWEDKVTPQPPPPPKRVQGQNVANIIDKIENKHPDWEKVGNCIAEKAANNDKDPRLTKRKYKRKRKSLEKEENKKTKEENNGKPNGTPSRPKETKFWK